MKRMFRGRLGVEAHTLAVILLFTLGVLAGIWNTRSWAVARERSYAQADLVTTSERLLSALKDLETGQRGFVLVGTDEFLAPYDDAVRLLPTRLEDFERAVRAAGAPIGEYTQIKDIVERKRAFIEETVAARRAGGFDAALALVATGRGKDLMDDARDRADALQRRAVAQASAIDRSAARSSLILSLASFAMALGALAYFIRLSIVRRREAERTKALLDAVFENAPIGLGFLDQNLKIQDINIALARMGETARAANVGDDLWSVLPTIQERLEPTLRATLTRGVAAADVEVEIPRRNNPQHVRHLSLSLYPLRARGQALPVGVGIVAVDTTAKRLAEKRLMDSERRFRMLITSTVAITWTTDPAGRFVDMQREWSEFTGQSFEDIQNDGWIEAIHPDDREMTSEIWRRAIENGAIYKVEYRIRRHDGEWRHMLVRAVPIRDDEDEIVEWIGASTDITDRKEMEIELEMARDAAEKANLAKSQFIANMSHELRTPLSAVIGYSEMLQEELEERGDDELIDDMRKIESNARHLLGLINDVLDLSKIEAEKMDVYIENFGVADMVRDVASTVDTLFAKKENAFSLELEGGEQALGAMRSDITKVRQCLINLLSNASKFTERGAIRLHVARATRESADWLTFSVADSGIGMTEEQLANLFERFAQADASTTRRFGGSGLGLAITRSFCTMLGGAIRVESKYGEGTTFSIDLPAEAPQAATFASVDETAAMDAPSHGVLIVDDDAATRDLLARFLQKEGFPIRAASDGKTGLDLARQMRPRVILLDVTMPRMDGWSVLRELKADPELCTIPVVMVTIIDEQNLAFTLGASDYLLKPIEWDRLKGVMDKLKTANPASSALIVDDDPDARQRLASMLSKNGWTIAQAQNGVAALEELAKQKPDLILLDLMMPEMDGFSFLREMRANPEWRDVPVVVLTAKDITAADRKRLLPDADRIIQKGKLDLRDLSTELQAYMPTHA